MAYTVKLQISDWNGLTLSEPVLYELQLAPYLSTDGFQLDRDGWNPQVSAAGEPVDEVLTVRVLGSTMQDLADKLNKLDKFAQYAARTANGEIAARFTHVWLYADYEDCDPMRAAVISIHVPQLVLKAGTRTYDMQITIRRMGKWERTTYSSASTLTFDPIGTAWGLTTSGAVAGRIKYIDFVTGVFSVKMVWAGFLTERNRTTLTNFVPTWSLSNANMAGADTTRSVADATAYNNVRCTCTFATSTPIQTRLRIKAGDVTANVADQAGRFEVLLRAKNSASMGVRVRLGVGYDAGSVVYYNPQTYVESTDWNWYSLGFVERPLSYFSTTEVEYTLQCGKYAGAGSIYLDCLTMIPAAEGRMHIRDAVQGGTLYFISDPLGRVYANGTDAVEIEADRFEYPFTNFNSSNARLVVAAQGTVSDKTAMSQMDIAWAPSYLTLRGTG